MPEAERQTWDTIDIAWYHIFYLTFPAKYVIIRYKKWKKIITRQRATTKVAEAIQQNVSESDWGRSNDPSHHGKREHEH